ncbi:MAG: cytochrome c3 family protein [Deltaproteobacteria bacterium]|nr:cytochrome c3 family protein [Deltaproteobacteria bacterium]
MFNIRRIPLLVFLVTVLSLSIWVVFDHSNIVVAQSQEVGPLTTAPITGPYKDLPVDAGVWNDGKAALWDLNIIDHYRYFGPKERAKGYKPEQPIKFNHIIHVQKNKMECQYCHWSVSKAAYAAIPEVETCMGCHKLVKGTDPASQAEIKKLDEFWAKGIAIPWNKVHVMPQYVNFNHKRHVKAGVNCQECHGQVPNMPEVERVTSMKMGWCIDCHRDRGTSIDCYTCHH